MTLPNYHFEVEINFSHPDTREFTDDDYRWFGCGDIERGKRNVEAAVQKLADFIDGQVLACLAARDGGAKVSVEDPSEPAGV